MSSPMDTNRALPALDVSSYDLQGFDGGVTIYGPGPPRPLVQHGAERVRSARVPHA